MKILLRILRYMRPYWRIAVMVYTALIGATLLTLISPWLIGNAVDAALGTADEFALYPADWSQRRTLAVTTIDVIHAKPSGRTASHSTNDRVFTR